MKKNVFLGLVVLGAVLQSAPASADIWYVNAAADPGGDGESWATAFDEIQDITPSTLPDPLAAGDEIWIAGGTYQALVTAYSGVQIYGGFPPTGDPEFGFRNSGLYPTIIDASSSNVGIEVETGALPSTVIDGLTIQNAGVFGIQNGDASEAQFSGLTLRNNGVDPLASASGAFQNGNDYAFAIVTNCLFDSNIGVAGGGGFRNPHKSSFLIERCTFRENQGSFGGALYSNALEVPTGCDPAPCDSQPIPIIRLSVFEDNSSTGSGGAIYESGDIKILACTFARNEAGDNGGAFFGVAGRTILQDNLFVENEAASNGGAISVQRGCEFSGHSCLFALNTATQQGGAMHILAMNLLTLQNCTVTENQAYQWPGVYAEVNDHACGPEVEFEATIENSILWHNGCDDDEVECTDYLDQLNVAIGFGGTLAVDYNDIRNLPGSAPAGFGAHNIDENPQFRDRVNKNWRLKGISPCIDAANGEVIPQDVEDADGDSRTACDGCNMEDSGEHIPDLDLARRIVDVLGLSATGLQPLDHCPLECDSVPDMGCHEFVACADCETRGDINDDGLLNGLDIDPFVQCAILETAAEISCLCGDFSGSTGAPDGVVDWYDVPCFIELLLTGSNSCSGPVLCGMELLSIVDCNENGIPDADDIAAGTSLDCNKNGVPDDCDIANETSNDVNGNDVPDECEVDCNGNDIPDAWDISEETSNDVNSNAIPDDCEPDCNGNDVPDAWDISTDESEDCNENGIPDECEDDCNNNDVPDDCDIASETSEDCNENGEPDECDLARSTLPSFDCNDNDVPDECDIASETSEDEDENGIPDECEMAPRGDGTGGGEIDAEAAWEEFFEWYEEQINDDPGDWDTLTGPERFDRVMDELELLGLPIARPW